MKKKISRILGVGLSVSLLTSLLMVAPVTGLGQPEVTPDDDTISLRTFYTIEFDLGEEVDEGEHIIITFPDEVDISDITAAVDADVTIAATAGLGSASFTATNAGSVTTDQELDITVPDVNLDDMIGRLARVTVVIGDAATELRNPDVAGDYTLTVETTPEDTPVESAVFTIEPPTPVVPPGHVIPISPGGDPFNAETGDNGINDAIGGGLVDDDWTLELTEGRWTTDVPNTGGFDGLTIRGAAGADVLLENDLTVNGPNFTLRM
jgi:hypothetical protein